MTPTPCKQAVIALAARLDVCASEPSRTPCQTLREAAQALRHLASQPSLCEAGRSAWVKLTEDTSWIDGRDVVLFVRGMEVTARYCPGEWSDDTPISPSEYSGAVWSCFDDAFQLEIEECSKDPREWGHDGATHWRAIAATPADGGDKSSDGGCICQDQHRRGYCTEPGCPYSLSETTPSAPSVAVKVKALTWRDHRPDSFPEPAWSAETPFGFYHIEEVSASDSPAYVVRLHAHHFIADKDSLEEAKAAAQADYEKRIRSCISTTSVDDGVVRVLSELRDRRLLNDVDDSLHEEIAESLIKAVQGALIASSELAHDIQSSDGGEQRKHENTLCSPEQQSESRPGPSEATPSTAGSVREVCLAELRETAEYWANTLRGLPTGESVSEYISNDLIPNIEERLDAALRAHGGGNE